MINLSYNEKIEHALSALRTMDIHQHPQPSDSILSKVAHWIKRDLLDTEKRLNQSPVLVTRAETTPNPWWMAVLPRTALMFHILATHLRCTIFVFSSRSLPAVYRPASSRGTIIFFHAINSFQAHSEFLVLQVKSIPAPQHTSPSSTALYAPSVPLSSSATLTGPSQDPQDPTVPFVPYAIYRAERRIRVHQPGLPNTEEMTEQCQEIYKMAW